MKSHCVNKIIAIFHEFRLRVVHRGEGSTWVIAPLPRFKTIALVFFRVSVAFLGVFGVLFRVFEAHGVLTFPGGDLVSYLDSTK